MKWVVANLKWIMLVSGALTCTMLYAALDLRVWGARVLRLHYRMRTRVSGIS